MAQERSDVRVWWMILRSEVLVDLGRAMGTVGLFLVCGADMVRRLFALSALLRKAKAAAAKARSRSGTSWIVIVGGLSWTSLSS